MLKYYPPQHQQYLHTIPGPCSSYASLVIHLSAKLGRFVSIEAPMKTEYFLYSGAITLTLILEGARFWTSFLTLSWMPGYMVVPPDMTMFS